MDVGTLSVKLSVLDQDAIKSLDSFQDKMKSIGSNITKIGAGMTAALTTPIILAGKHMFDAASDFNESINKVEVSFGDASDEVKAFSKTTLQNFGIAQGSALEMAALFGDMGTSMGLTTKDAANMSKGLVGLAGDLASFKNVQIDVAQTALAGIFTGETESLKRLGIVMTEANLELFALSQGITKNIDDMTQAEKVQLRYAYVTKMSSNATGDFARTSDSAANQTRIFNESVEELSVSFGQELLPTMTPIIEEMNKLVQSFNKLDTEQKQTIITMGGIVAIGGPVLLLIGGLINAITLILSPIGLMISGFSAVIGIMALQANAMYNLGEETILTSNIITKTMDTLVKSSIEWGANIVKNIWDGFKGWWNWLVSGIMGLVEDLAAKIKINLDFGWLTDLLSIKVNPSPIPTGTGNLGLAGNTPLPAPKIQSQGVQQTVVINSPTTLSPKVVSKETTKLAQALAKGLYV